MRHWSLALLAHQAFGIVLGAEIGIVEAFRLVEHVLAEHARVQAGGRNRTGVVEAAGLERVGQLQGMPRAIDVGRDLARFVGRQVVDRGEVEEMRDLAAQVPERAPASRRRRGLPRSPVTATTRSLSAPSRSRKAANFFIDSLRTRHMDRALALEQLLQQEATDEPGSAGHEITHFPTPFQIQAAPIHRPAPIPSGAIGATA